jgi:hypothetical protein
MQQCWVVIAMQSLPCIRWSSHMYAADVPPGTAFYHGTKADLAIGDLITPGFGSNFVDRALAHIYFSATLDAATWGAELAGVRGAGESTLSSRLVRSRTIPTSRTRNSRAM